MSSILVLVKGGNCSQLVLCSFFLLLLLSDHALWGKYLKDPHKLAVNKAVRCSPELLNFRKYRYFYHLCRHQPEVALTAFKGLEEAVKQCQIQMKFDRWDCTQQIYTKTTAYTVLHNPPVLKYGYRETAFLVALSSAGAAWKVATACVQGKLETCTCNIDQHANQQSWEWGGCSYGVKFGLITSRRLLTRKIRSTKQRGLMRKMEKHNLKAGRMAVKRTLIRSCKCHGVSGSCQMKTCWSAASNLNQIGDHLKKKYSNAKFVLQHNSPNDSRHAVLKAKSSELVYVEESPSFCKPMPHMGTTGTKDRVCNVRNDTYSIGDCDKLCCSRGQRSYQQKYTEKCKCKFIWCCRVTCETCLKSRWVSTCR